MIDFMKPLIIVATAIRAALERLTQAFSAVAHKQDLVKHHAFDSGWRALFQLYVWHAQGPRAMEVQSR